MFLHLRAAGRWKMLIAVAVWVGALFCTGRAVAQAQYQVLYNFCSVASCVDGTGPVGSLVADKAGNLYGATGAGGAHQGGTVFALKKAHGVWHETVLHDFAGGSGDGAFPMAGVAIDASGNLYGTTRVGGPSGEGTVYKLSRPSNQDGTWAMSLLWGFGTQGDGLRPVSELTFDAAGNLYGTTSGGGTEALGGGTAFQLVPNQDGSWSENILFSFGPDPFNGYDPTGGITFDKSGNIYGTTLQGGAHNNSGWGVIYKLTPTKQLPWTGTVLFRFTKGTGANPRSEIAFDGLGNIYTTLSDWGGFGGGVFRLTPNRHEHTVYFGDPGGPDPSAPAAGLFLHGSALYGTSERGGVLGLGTVFKLQRQALTVLYSFCAQSGCTDGAAPDSTLIAYGQSLFGTAGLGGANNSGVVFQLSEPQPVRKRAASKRGSSVSKIRPVATSH